MTQLATLAPSLLAIRYVAEQSGGEFSWPSRFLLGRCESIARRRRCVVGSTHTTQRSNRSRRARKPRLLRARYSCRDGSEWALAIQKCDAKSRISLTVPGPGNCSVLKCLQLPDQSITSPRSIPFHTTPAVALISKMPPSHSWSP